LDPLNYWSALTDATSVKDGKLRFGVLISELEHAGYQATARCLADDLDAVNRAPAIPPATPRTLAVNEPPREIARRSAGARR